mmetsp:Transcript_8711/g.26112  ORF Transcript_8711/g.26112 Transcript_8711/m.26112 type:complete len:228 (-) Transcript_8711:741-1424(-)
MDDVWLLTAAARVLHRAGLRAEAQLQAVEGVLAAVITWPASRLVRGARRVLYAALHRTLGAPAVLADVDVAGAAERAGGRTARDMGHLAFPLVTMTVYGVTHYLRWANLAHAVGVRIPRRHRALVATSFLLLPNLLVPVLDVWWLHVVLVSVVAVNNLYLYREFCIHEQLHLHGQRLPGEPVVIAFFQAVHVLHEALEGPGRELGRRVWPFLPRLVTIGRASKFKFL